MTFSLSSQQSVPLRVALEPVYNTLNTFSLLTVTEELPGLNTWVTRTAAPLAPERRHANRLVFEGLRAALLAELDAPDFPTYLARLAEQDPYKLRDRALNGLRSRFSRRFPSHEAPEAPDTLRLLNDVQAYLTCVEYALLEVPFDRELHSEVHALLNDPPAMHALLVSHLAELWQTFAAEWKRVQATLRWQVAMYTHSLAEQATVEETFCTFTGRELPSAIAMRLNTAAIEEVVLVPTWHTGRQVTLWEDGARARLFFSEPPNYDVAGLRAAPVGRPELLARLTALADETRLRIIELLMQHDELHAQEIIAALDLSQSSVSRHLKQLVSLGYLYERRGEGANKTYRLSSFYFARTARALEQLVLSAQSEHPEAAVETQSQELRRFLDRSGRLTIWPPSKQRDKLLILEYLASFFEHGRVYSEKEVNELLLLHSTMNDSASLRRACYEYRFMNRTRDGSQYWLSGTAVPEGS